MTTILVVIVLFLLVTFGIAFWSRRALARPGAHPLHEYFIAGRGMGYLPLAATITATALSIWSFLGLPGMVYRTGFAVFFIPAIGPLIATVMYLVGRRIWELGRKYEYITASDLLADRYDSEAMRYIVAVAMMLTAMPYIAIQFIGMGFILSNATGGAITFSASAIFFALFVAVYCTIGGFRAVVYTDVLQAAIFIFGAIYLLGAVLGPLDGLSGAVATWEQEDPAFLGLPGLTPFWGTVTTLGFTINLAVGLAMQPQMWSRYYSAQDRRTLGFATLIGWGVIGSLVVGVIVMFSVGLPLTVSGLEGRATDGVIPIFLSRYGHPVITGIIFSAIIAASLSTQDSQVVALGSVLTQDVIQRVRPQTDQAVLMRVSKGSVWVWMAIALVIALFTRTVIFQLLLIAYAFVLVIFPATVGALYWPRGTRAGAVWSVVVGEAIVIVGALVMGYGDQPILWGFNSAVIAFFVSVIVYVVVSLLTPAPSAQIVQRFHARA